MSNEEHPRARNHYDPNAQPTSFTAQDRGTLAGLHDRIVKEDLAHIRATMQAHGVSHNGTHMHAGEAPATQSHGAGNKPVGMLGGVRG